MSYQIVEGIVKIIRQDYIGIADGKGQFLWVKSAEIVSSFPPAPLYNWQTIRLILLSTAKINWKPEKNWEQFKHTYNATNIKPLPYPIPAEFAIEPQLQLPPNPNIGIPMGTMNPTMPPIQRNTIPQPAPQPTIPEVNNPFTNKIAAQSDIPRWIIPVIGLLSQINDQIKELIGLYKEVHKIPAFNISNQPTNISNESSDFLPNIFEE